MNVNVEKEEFILKSPSMAIRKIMYESVNDLEGVSRVKELWLKTSIVADQLEEILKLEKRVENLVIESDYPNRFALPNTLAGIGRVEEQNSIVWNFRLEKLETFNSHQFEDIERIISMIIERLHVDEI